MRDIVLVLVVVAPPVIVFLLPPIPQDPAYHELADERRVLGIPNGLNVLSNAPFLAVGLAGLHVTWRRSRFLDRWERRPYTALFAGVTLTAAGSAWYHLAPDNARLVWDRLPMAVGFMGLLTAVVAERVRLDLARRLFVPLLAAGVLSVGYWWWTEGRGAGDLRPYILVQYGAILFVLLLLVLYRSRYTGAGYLAAALAVYGAAKLFELADAAVFELGGVASGHTLKHLIAAVAVGCIAVMLRVRRPVRDRQENRT